MTWPVTPNPGIHDDTQSVQQQNFFSLPQILKWAEQLPLAMIKDLANAILSALGLGGVVPTADNIITDIYNALLDIPQGNISGLISDLENIVSTIVTALGGTTVGKDLEGLLKEAGSLLGGLGHTIEADVAGALTDVEGLILNPIGTIEGWVKDLEKLLGLGGGGGSTTTGSGSGTGVTTTTLTLTQLLGLMGTATQVSGSQLQAFAPSTSPNVLTDPSFSTGLGIQGNGQWCWDGWVGDDATSGTIGALRTVRTGLITVYVAPGTPGGIFTPAYDSGTILEWLQNPAQSYLANGYMFSQLDPTFFETILVPYPVATYPPTDSVQQGINWLINTINAVPGPFILVGEGQGTLICSGVYDQIRYGSLTSRRNDLLAGVMFGGMRREQGHAFPGYTPAVGTSGAVVEAAAIGPYTAAGDPTNPAGGNLIDTEDLWYDFCAPTDFLTCCPVNGTMSTIPGGWVPSDTSITGSPMPSSMTSVIDGIMTAGLAKPGVAPGVTIGISGPMGYYYQSYGTGMSNSGYFRMNSVTKTFTATAILQAVGDSLLGLDDVLDTYVTGVPNGDIITIAQLLSMQSGVYDYTQNESFKLALILGSDASYTPAKLLALIKAGASAFTPGTQYGYTDSNYVLLGYVLEAVYSSTDATAVITDNVITPAGLSETQWPTGRTLPTPADTAYVLEALDYLGLSSGRTTQSGANTLGTLWTSGALVQTISDAVAWGETGLGNTLLTSEMQQARMTTFLPVTQDPGSTPWTTFGYGLGLLTVGSWFGHDGSWPGFSSCVMFEPTTQTVIAVSENFQTTTSPYVLAALSLYWWNVASYLLPSSVTGAGYSPGGTDSQVAAISDGIQGLAFRELFHTVMQSYTGGDLTAVTKAAETAYLSSAPQISQAAALQDYYVANPENPTSSYFYWQPNLTNGDSRSAVQIGLDYIAGFAGGHHPDGTPISAPAGNGLRHQYALDRFAVQPGQVVDASARVGWVNVGGSGDQILLCVNVYDVYGDLLATIGGSSVVPGATISDPASSSNWVFQTLQDDFVMPPLAAFACPVIDVESEAMTTGIVWVDNLVFEVTSLIDGALIDSTTLSKISGKQISGLQATADMATYIQNMVDGLASAGGNVDYSGTQLEQMIQAAAQQAANSQLGYTLGVVNNQILSNVSAQPLSNTMHQAGQSTVDLPTAGTLPTTTLSADEGLIGFINSNQNVTIGFVEFEAKSTGGSGVYVNAYTVDTVAGTLTQIWTSGDISSSVPTSSYGWVGIEITSAAQFTVGISEIVALEIVSQSSGLSVVSSTWGHATNTNWALPNQGATRSTTSTGGAAPTSLTSSQVTFSQTAPYVCMAVLDLPPTYMPPAQQEFTAAGLQTYSLPSWGQVSGTAYDVVSCGAGGSGGYFAGSNKAAGIGQGAAAGDWSTQTLMYGTDIPGGTTELTVINGNGGNAPSATGGDTIVGYGFTTPPAFDAVGAGGTVHNTILTWSHTATAGAYVIVGINTGFGTFNVTYGTTPMLPLGLVYNDNLGSAGATALYGLPDAPSGAQTITVTLNQAAYVTGNSLSFTNVSNVGLVTSTDSNGTALSHTVNCGTNQAIVQAFGTYQAHMSGFTGGTNKYSGNYPAVTSGKNTYYYQGLSLSYATATTTFTATDNVADDWGSIAVILNPAGTVLVTAPGGQGGGPGGASNYNPANSNATSTGLGPGNQSWAGKFFQGGLDTTTTDAPGNAPGGGSAGGDSIGTPQNGAIGYTSITARQPATVTSGGGGFSGSGASGPVTYEALGTGASTSSATTLTWTHNSGGGPNAAALLYVSAHWGGSLTSITASYGSTTFNRTIDDCIYYVLGSTNVGVFVLGLIGLPSGSQTITLTFGGVSSISAAAANTVSYTNVSGFGNFYVGNAPPHGVRTSGLAVNGIPLTANDLAVGVLSGWTSATPLTSFNQTQRWIDNTEIPIVVGDCATVGTVDFTASQGSAEPWGAVGGILVST